MLSRKKKTRPWLKRKHEGLKLLTRITHVFKESESLEESFQKIGEFLSDHVHSIASGIYIYDQAADRFSLQFSGGQQEVFAEHAELTPDDLQGCHISPTEFGMIHVIPSQTKKSAPPCFLQTSDGQTVQSVAHLPLIAHKKTYGIVLIASKFLHRITEEETNFFTVVAQHLSLATEKALLTSQFEHKFASKVSQLQESEEKYRILFEDASDAIVLVDINTQQFIEVNRQAAVLVGYSREELLTMTVNDFWVRKDAKRLPVSLLRSVIKRGSARLGERQIRKKDGQLLWIEINATAVEYHGEHVILAIIRDITQRKQIELEKDAIDAVNKILISSHDVREVYTTVGQNLLKVFYFDWMDILLPGSTSQTLRLFMSINVNKNVSNLEEQEYSHQGTTVKNVFRTGKPEIVNYRDEKTDRSIPELLGKKLQESLFFPLEYQEEVIGALHFGSYRNRSFSPRHFDFLSRIASQLAIAIENTLLFHKVNEERAVYKHLIENVNEIVFQVDLKGKIIFVNHRVRNILGYTPDEIIETNFFSYVFPEDLEEAKAAIEHLRGHGFGLAYETHITAQAAAAAARLWQLTGDATYLDLSYGPVANLLRLSWLYEVDYGPAAGARTFFGLMPTQRAAVITPKEQYEAWIFLAEYLRRAHGHIAPSAEKLVAEFCQHTLLTLPYAFSPLLPEGVHFVPGHPVAGTEHSGPEAGFAELFEDRWCILTPPPGTDQSAVDRITALWRACGSMVEIMSPSHHDKVLAITSHLPHLLAYTIVGTATGLEESDQAEVVKFSAGGFRDFTRIAASDPVMWRDVFLNNREAVHEMLQRFSEDITAMQRAIRWGEGEVLQSWFERTRGIRRDVIEAHQAGTFDARELEKFSSAEPDPDKVDHPER